MELQIFNNEEFGDVRVVMKNDIPWFVAADVCRVLELTNPTVALERLDEDEKAKFNLGLPGGETNVVNESGLYALTLTSRKPNAKKFRKIAALGLQYKDGKDWRLTDAGKAYGEEMPYTRNGHSGYQIRWNASIIDFLNAV